ncbi:MAG: aminotransferase class V-fold PLP-dependent enzyme [bacterium]
MIYFDNAATSWPKPESVYKAVDNCLRNIGANPGRSGHKMSVEAGRVVYNCRELLADFFHVDDPSRIIHCFNATDALNIAINCLLKPGDHAITTSIEHNSVMRPLRYLEQKINLDLTVVKTSPEGFVTAEDIKREIKDNTRLVVVTHASNVIGTLVPIREIGAMLKGYPDVCFLVDTAQSAGVIKIDVEADNLDLLAFAGHKGLFGPQGTGGLYVGPGMEEIIDFLKQGGTGSDSEQEYHPDFLPDKYESGTKNTPGLAGLTAGVEFINKTGIDNIHAHALGLTKRLNSQLQNIDEVIVYGPRDETRQTSVVSFNILGMEPSDVSYALDQEYEVMTRVGLHCAPSTHLTIGTSPKGTVRLSMEYFNTEKEVDAVCDAVKGIIQKHK